MVRREWKSKVLWAIGFALFTASTHAGDLSGTYLDPALQRQDIFSHHIWKGWPEYRAVYNRPRYFGGHVAAIIEPSSQEAMAWHENVCNGNYENCRGASVPHYYYQKPWEAINTRARPDNRPIKENVRGVQPDTRTSSEEPAPVVERKSMKDTDESSKAIERK